MSPGEADRYANLEIRIVQGHNPDLVVQGTGRRVDLTTYATTKELHALLLEEGFALRTDTEVQNRNSKCFEWRSTGQCVSNPAYMRETCALACRHLVDRSASCAAWANDEQCVKNPGWMNVECPVSCGWKQEL